MSRGRVRTSKIWLMDEAEFVALIKNSRTTTEALSYFGLKNIGGNNRTIWGRIKELSLDTGHLRTLSDWCKSRDWAVPAIPLEQILVLNSTYSRVHLKRRLINDEILENVCAICRMLPIWNGRALTLRLDHENGVRDDNRIENLRLLCPNCDSQLDTFCGRNNKFVKPKRKKVDRRRKERIVPKCPDCDKSVSAKGCRCVNCGAKERWKDKNNSIDWPALHELKLETERIGKSAVARRLGVDESTVRFRLKKLNEVIPNQPMVG